MPTIEIPNDWAPRDYQLPLWRYLEGGGKRAVAVWHRRAGKDSTALNWTAFAGLQRVGTYFHLLPELKHARKVVWDAIDGAGRRLIDQAFPPAIRVGAPHDQEMRIRLANGSVWQCVGSDNYDAIVGSNPIGVAFSEWALADPLAWSYIRPILAENSGWALFMYTPRGRNHGAAFYDTARQDPEWFCERLRADQTRVFAPEVLDRERRELIRESGPEEGAALFQQEYMCSFEAPMAGSYYGAWMSAAEEEGRIGRVPYEPNLKVETWWDLGVGDSTAIWFAQRHHREVRLIDYYEASGEGLQHYARVLQERGYVYGRHVAPHDVQVRELGSGKSRRETAAGLGIAFDVVPLHSVEDGIQAVRDLLGRCWFDAEKCRRGIEALRGYHKAYDDKLRTYQSHPVHDWSSHAADAFRYGASAGEPHEIDYRKLNPFNRPRGALTGPNAWMAM